MFSDSEFYNYFLALLVFSCKLIRKFDDKEICFILKHQVSIIFIL